MRGVSFAGGTREYVIEAPFGTVKAEADATLAPYGLGESVAFELPLERAATLVRD